MGASFEIGAGTDDDGIKKDHRIRILFKQNKRICARARSGMLKEAIAYAIRPTARVYIQYAPWILGKRTVYDLFDKYIAWRTHRTRVRTRFAGVMELWMPDLVSTTIYLTGRWEPLITRYVQANLKSGDTFIDVGADIGYYALLASRIVVRSDTLGELVGVQNLRAARFIKIDVEGAECPVLAPVFDSLSEFSPSTEWRLELSADNSAGGQGDVDRIFSAFISQGYRAYTLENKYDSQFLLDPPSAINLVPLTDAPRGGLCDVLMTRQPRSSVE